MRPANGFLDDVVDNPGLQEVGRRDLQRGRGFDLLSARSRDGIVEGQRGERIDDRLYGSNELVTSNNSNKNNNRNNNNSAIGVYFFGATFESRKSSRHRSKS